MARARVRRPDNADTFDSEPCSAAPPYPSLPVHSKSATVALEGGQFLPTYARGTAPSFLWFAAIQSIERKKDSADLAREGCFIAAEAVERVIGQIGQTQEAACEIECMMDVRPDRFQPRAEHGFCCTGRAFRCQIAIEIDGVSAPL